MGKTTNRKADIIHKDLEDSSSSESWLLEFRLRALHDLIPEALLFPNFATNYVSFVKTLRERLHPIGRKDIRVVETKSGFKLHVNLGDRLGCDFYYGYFQELFDSCLFLDMIDAGATVFDIGANFGYYTVMAASKVGPSGIIHSFEPNKSAYELLKTNVKTNEFEKIVFCHDSCIGETDGETDFYVSEESSFSSRGQTERAKLMEKRKVPLRSLDSLMPELGLSKIGAIKIDVEGFEFSVLRGAREMIRNSPNLLIMMEVSAKNLDEQRRQELITSLADIYNLGFRGWVIDSGAELRLIKDAEDAAKLGSANLFLVGSKSEKEKQLQQAYKELRVKAFHAISEEIGVPEKSLIGRNITDPYSPSNLHNALIASLLRERDAVIDDLRSRIQERDTEVKDLKSIIEKIEADSMKRLELLKKRDEEVLSLKELFAKAEQENKSRLELIHKHEAKIDELNKKLEYWRQEATTLKGIGRQMIKKIRNIKSEYPG